MRMLSVRQRVLLVVAAMCLSAGSAAARSEAPVVAAAADLQFVIGELAARFVADTGLEVRLSLGSTGNFARQIRQGAPYQLFMAADEAFVFDLARDGFTRDEGALYAVGRIVVIVPEGSTLVADGALESLREALADGRITRFAIANPEHAPYGRRAEEALRHAGLWEAIQPYLVLGENVAQAAQFALSGNAEGGIIAYSLALAPDVARRGSYELISEDWHQPLRQRMVLLNGAGAVAEAFHAYVQTPAAREILARSGFVVPDE